MCLLTFQMLILIESLCKKINSAELFSSFAFSARNKLNELLMLTQRKNVGARAQPHFNEVINGILRVVTGCVGSPSISHTHLLAPASGRCRRMCRGIKSARHQITCQFVYVEPNKFSKLNSTKIICRN